MSYPHPTLSTIFSCPAIARKEIPEAEIHKLSSIFRPLNLSAGTFFVRAPEVPKTLGFIVSGILRLYDVDNSGVGSQRLKNLHFRPKMPDEKS